MFEYIIRVVNDIHHIFSNVEIKWPEGTIIVAQSKNAPVIICDGNNMSPNVPGIIKLWDDRIQEFLKKDDVESAWEIFLSKPNKKDYPWIHHMYVELPEVGRFDLCAFGADGYWNRNEVIKLDYFVTRLKDWIDDEYNRFESFTNGKNYTRVRINSNPDFAKACKKTLIENNFGSMEYDW